MRIGLLPEKLAGAHDAALPPGHQAIQIGPPDEARPGAHRDRRHDIATAEDAAVDVHLRAVPDGCDDRRQLLQWRRRPVELPAAVVRDHDRIGSGVDDDPGVIDRLDTLDDDRPVPFLAQPAQVCDRDRRIEHAVDEVGDRPLRLLEGGEPERLGRQQVEPPAGMERDVGDGPDGQGRRDREAVVDVSQPRAGHRCVDGQDERGEAGGPRAANEIDPRVTIVPQVELEPLVGFGCGACHVLGRRRAKRREGIRDAQPPGHPRDRRFALVVHQPGEARRCEDEGQGGRPSEDRRRGVDLRHVLEHAWHELDASVGLARSPQTGLALGSAVDVVEDRSRCVPARDRSKIPDRGGGRQAAIRRVEVDRARPEVWLQLPPARKAASGLHVVVVIGGRSHAVARNAAGRTSCARASVAPRDRPR